MTYVRNTPTRRDWADNAACREPAEDFWHTDGEANEEQAKKICGTCPVATQCLTEAMRLEAADPKTGARFGIWGGLTGGERAQLAAFTTRRTVA